RRPPAVVATLHGTDVPALGDNGARRQVRDMVLGSDGVFVPSAWLRRKAMETLGLPAQLRVDVLPNFVDPEAFHPLDNGSGEVPALFPALEGTKDRRPAGPLLAADFPPA